MFRTQQNGFDDAVIKATDENLTSENWEFIMDVCDKVSADENGAKDAVAAMRKRLTHRNANVQLYTLELANALSQNCDKSMHRELASRSFTDALLRLASDRNSHQQVKAKILERMTDWAEMFASDPDLGIMEQAYMRLKTQNPNLHPPSKPQKTLITDADRRREDDELQMALALSIKEKDKSGAGQTQPSSYQTGPTGATQAQPQPVQPGTTAATVSRVRALFDFQPSEPGELQFRKGDVIAVLESVYKDWWRGSLRGQTGIFPLNYVEKLQDPTREELEREALMEADVFAEMKNVEKLLALLSTSSENGRGDVRDNEEITTLYHSTLAIRPKLIELIGKYTQKKEDFTQLNEKFIKARKDYETLLEASMSHPPQPTYGRPAYGFGGQPQQGAYSNVSGYGQPPQSQEQRYYSPGPGEPQYPPSNGPQPFYFVPPNQKGQMQPTQQPPTANPSSSTDDLYAAPQRTNVARPATIAFDPRVGSGPGGVAGGIPQELASGSFDSPVDNRHSYAQPQSNQGAASPPPQQLQQQQQQQQPPQSQHFDPYAPTAAQRPSSPYSSNHPQLQKQNSQNAIYTLPSQQQYMQQQQQQQQQPQPQPQPSQQAPSDPYPSYGARSDHQSQQGHTTSHPSQSSQSLVAPDSTAPSQPQQPQVGYPPVAGPPTGTPIGGSAPSAPYQAYNPSLGNVAGRWTNAPSNAPAAAGQPVGAGGRGDDEGYYR